jgi:hypothetical protein
MPLQPFSGYSSRIPTAKADRQIKIGFDTALQLQGIDSKPKGFTAIVVIRGSNPYRAPRLRYMHGLDTRLGLACGLSGLVV